MFDDAGRVVFMALRDAARARLGLEHPCALALAEAAEDPRAARAAAQAALAALPEAERTALMGAAHGALRADPRAWMSLWGGAGPRH